MKKTKQMKNLNIMLEKSLSYMKIKINKYISCIGNKPYLYIKIK